MSYNENTGVFAVTLLDKKGIPMVSSIDPWLVVGLAAYYREERDLFQKAGIGNAADQADYMLNAMMELAGIVLHGQKDYFTWGEGNEEYLRNCGDEAA